MFKAKNDWSDKKLTEQEKLKSTIAYLPEGRKSPRAKTKPKTRTATPTPIYSFPE